MTMGDALQHLAQINVGRLLHAEDDPRVAGFYNNLDRINALAERSPGFVWRLKDDSGNATNIRAFDDPRMMLNMSVWESAEALEKFVWQSAHTTIYRQRPQWLEKLDRPHFAMWWIPLGHVPSVEEGKARLDHLATKGSSEFAFGWEHLTQAKLWKAARCA